MHPVGLLVLAGTTVAKEIELLGRAARFLRETEHFVQEDIEFCNYAGEALAQTSGEEACHELLSLLVESGLTMQHRTGGNVRHALSKHPNSQVTEKFRSLLSLSRSKAVYRIARDYQKKDPVSAAFAALFQRRKYSRVFGDLEFLAE